MFTFGKDRTDTSSYFTCHIFKIEKIFFISVFESRNAGKSNYKARSVSRVEKKLILRSLPILLQLYYLQSPGGVINHGFGKIFSDNTLLSLSLPGEIVCIETQHLFFIPL